MARLTYEAYGKKTLIEVDFDDLDLNDMFESLIIPMLLAAGYQQKSISEYFGEEE